MYMIFDIGGTKMRVAASVDGKSIISPEVISTPEDFEQGIQALRQLVEKIAGAEKIESLAGGIAGPLDKDKTMLVASPHLGAWVNMPFKQRLQALLGCPVMLENDADLAALGEANFGAGIGRNIVVYLTISTGVGGGRIVNGKMDANSQGFEPGHQIIIADGDPCNCGGIGHLESYVSGSAIERIYGKKGEDIKDPKIWEEVAQYLALGLNNTIVHWSPDIIVLGGSVMQSISIDTIKTYLQIALTIFPTCPDVVPSKLGDSSGLYGTLKLLPPKSFDV